MKLLSKCLCLTDLEVDFCYLFGVITSGLLNSKTLGMEIFALIYTISFINASHIWTYRRIIHLLQVSILLT